MGKLYLGDQEIGVYQAEKAEQPLVKFTVDADGKIHKGGDTFVLPSNVKALEDEYIFYYLYKGGTVTSADLSSLATISGKYGAYGMFQACTSLTSVDLSSLTTISGYYGASSMFYDCKNLTSVDLSSLTTVSGYYGVSSMFYGCSKLTSVDLSSLTTISNNSAFSYAFQGCSSLTSVDLSSLTNISMSGVFSSAFYGCLKLKDLRFPALTADSFGSYTNQFSNMLNGGVTGCTLHFPAAIQAKVQTLTGYPKFGGTNTTVLFDL